MTTDQWIGLLQGLGPLLAVGVAYLIWRLDFSKRYDPFRLEFYKRKLDSYTVAGKLVEAQWRAGKTGGQLPSSDIVRAFLEAPIFIDMAVLEPVLHWLNEGAPPEGLVTAWTEYLGLAQAALDRDIQELLGEKQKRR